MGGKGWADGSCWALADRLGPVPGTWEQQLEQGWDGKPARHTLSSFTFTATKLVSNALACARPFPRIISL